MKNSCNRVHRKNEQIGINRVVFEIYLFWLKIDASAGVYGIKNDPDYLGGKDMHIKAISTTTLS